MLIGVNKLKFAAGAFVFSLVLLLGAGVTANAQWGYDPYYGGDRDEKSMKRRQKEEKEDLKRRQKREREMYGNSDELRRRHEWEREQLERRHDRQEEARDRQGRYGDDGYYGRDDDDYYGRRRDRDYRHEDVYQRSDIRQEAYNRGYQEGLRAGSDDRYSNRRYDYEDHRTYRDATAGYRDHYGDRNTYRNNFREGFRRGYDEGYNRGGTYRRNRSGGGWGSILGGILGLP